MNLSYQDYLELLTSKTDQELEEMAKRAHELTLKHFGRIMQLYVPLYLSNECDNNCLYCGFSQKLGEVGVTLSVKEVLEEADILYQKGFRHILLVSGEKRDKVTLSYLKEIISHLHQKFESISLEIFPLEEHEYRELFLAGADGLTIYQEVYNREIYQKVHPQGAKSDYDYRFKTPERAARAGFYRINMGALLGLGDFYEEASLLGKHVAYLKKRYWQAHISVSFPRLKESGANFAVPHPVSDRELVQLICALRIFQPTLGLVLSTREGKELRDHLIFLGITQMSAESKTNPCGYSKRIKSEEQFQVSDQRSLKEVSLMLARKGYEPVFKDWDRAFIRREG